MWTGQKHIVLLLRPRPRRDDDTRVEPHAPLVNLQAAPEHGSLGKLYHVRDGAGVVTCVTVAGGCETTAAAAPGPTVHAATVAITATAVAVAVPAAVDAAAVLATMAPQAPGHALIERRGVQEIRREPMTPSVCRFVSSRRVDLKHLGFRVPGFRFQGLGFRVCGLRFGIKGLGFRV